MNISIVGNLKPEDDFTHEVTSAENFNESFLFHFSGTSENHALYGGLIRVANRPNQGYAECTVLLWLPDGTALFNFERPKIYDNASWNRSGWVMEVLRPGGLEFRTRYSGQAMLLPQPRMLSDPKNAREKAPRVTLELDLTHVGKGPLTQVMSHWKQPSGRQAEGAESRGEPGMLQFMHCEGSFALDGGKSITFKGYGWRDHNWGPRNWQGFNDHTFLTANFDDDEGISLFSADDRSGYAYHRGGHTALDIRRAAVDIQYRPGTLEPVTLRAEYRLEDGTEGAFTGIQRGYIPLRNVRNGMVTSIGYSLWEYRRDSDDFPFYGLGEFLKQNPTNSANEAPN